VAIRNFAFEPDTLEVAIGDTVVWRNGDVVPHTATSQSAAWDSRELAAAAEWTLVVQATGTQPYSCTFHPNMRGALVVRD
jgi:plastocyanin